VRRLSQAIGVQLQSWPEGLAQLLS
jgi:hypothetical protein